MNFNPFCPKPKPAPVTLETINHKLDTIMSAVSDYAAKVNAFLDTQGKDIDALTTELATLNSELSAIQTSPGTLSAEDQASLDSALARTSAITDRLTALSAVTPPAAPAA